MALLAMMLRVLLAALFSRAAWHKWQDWQSFAREISAYQLLPVALLVPVAQALIAAETLCVLLLFVHNAGLLLAALLLLLYAGAMAINVLRGRTQIDCGCAGSHSARTTISWWLVVRNILLATLALLAASLSLTYFSLISMPIIAAGSISSILIYEAIDQALANSQRYRRWLSQQPQPLG